MFRLKPSLPRYTATYDASRGLYYLNRWDPQKEALTFKESSMKLTILLCLLTANRDQVLPVLDTTQMKSDKNGCIFVINEIMKTTRSGKHIHSLELIADPHDYDYVFL